MVTFRSAGLILLSLCLFLEPSLASAHTGKITAFPLPYPVGPPSPQLVRGSDGNLWFNASSFVNDYIGRITPAGQIKEFTIPLPPGQQGIPAGFDLAAGPDGSVWFTANLQKGPHEFVGYVGRVTPAGAITLFPTPTPMALPENIVAGSGNTLWFTEASVGVGRITTSGQITEFRVPGGAFIAFNHDIIVPAADGTVWFCTGDINQGGGVSVARVTPAGHVTLFTFPFGGSINHLTVGPDGNIWFLENDYPNVERADDGVVLRRDQGGHVQGRPNAGAPAPHDAPTTQGAALAVERGDADQGRDGLAVELAQLGHLGEQGQRGGRPDAA